MPEQPSKRIRLRAELSRDSGLSEKTIYRADKAGKAGRSATAQLLHASECAFWDNLPVQMASLLEVVADIDGTEICLETTGNSYNELYNLRRKSEAGETDFTTIFLPFSLENGYRKAVRRLD